MKLHFLNGTKRKQGHILQYAVGAAPVGAVAGLHLGIVHSLATPCGAAAKGHLPAWQQCDPGQLGFPKMKAAFVTQQQLPSRNHTSSSCGPAAPFLWPCSSVCNAAHHTMSLAASVRPASTA